VTGEENGREREKLGSEVAVKLVRFLGSRESVMLYREGKRLAMMMMMMMMMMI
jgi:hypothetical protein